MQKRILFKCGKQKDFNKDLWRMFVQGKDHYQISNNISSKQQLFITLSDDFSISYHWNVNRIVTTILMGLFLCRSLGRPYRFKFVLLSSLPHFHFPTFSQHRNRPIKSVVCTWTLTSIEINHSVFILVVSQSTKLIKTFYFYYYSLLYTKLLSNRLNKSI